jgi:hypothetical protein
MMKVLDPPQNLGRDTGVAAGCVKAVDFIRIDTAPNTTCHGVIERDYARSGKHKAGVRIRVFTDSDSAHFSEAKTDSYC